MRHAPRGGCRARGALHGHGHKHVMKMWLRKIKTETGGQFGHCKKFNKHLHVHGKKFEKMELIDVLNLGRPGLKPNGNGPQDHGPQLHGPHSHGLRGHGPHGHGPHCHRHQGHGYHGHGHHGHGHHGHGHHGHGHHGHKHRGHVHHGHGPHGHGPHGHGPHGHGPHGHGPHGHRLHGHGPHGHGPPIHGPHEHGPHGNGPHGNGPHGNGPQGQWFRGHAPHVRSSCRRNGHEQNFDLINCNCETELVGTLLPEINEYLKEKLREKLAECGLSEEDFMQLCGEDHVRGDLRERSEEAVEATGTQTEEGTRVQPVEGEKAASQEEERRDPTPPQTPSHAEKNTHT